MSAKVILYTEVKDKKTQKKKYIEYDTVLFENKLNLSQSALEMLITTRYGENLIRVTVRDISSAKFKYENHDLMYTITLYLKTKDTRPIEAPKKDESFGVDKPNISSEHHLLQDHPILQNDHA
jgi:hypothetical protein